MSAIGIEISEKIMWLTLDRPPVNALSYAVYEELSAAFTRADANDDVYVTIIRATGKYFSAGNDLRELSGIIEGDTFPRPYQEVVEEGLTSIIRSSKPVICLVQGPATGAGFCIPSYSDIVVATENASFGIAEIQRGVIGGAPEASYSLPPKVVRYMALTGSFITAEEALSYGFVRKVVSEHDLYKEGERIARRIIANPPLSIRFMKESLASIYPPGRIEALIKDDETWNDRALHTEDFSESVRAFLEKRDPVYHGR
ncbi:MAG: enoyl-CoA hydratase/isomerase family protein [Clostridiales Family XIII bacterium]|jgi:enoyl-CoA hydratase|nr:enoyl-CoA hydratase/isomerase family protein [Clostridiales Family XIII bacterium]